VAACILATPTRFREAGGGCRLHDEWYCVIARA